MRCVNMRYIKFKEEFVYARWLLDPIECAKKRLRRSLRTCLDGNFNDPCKKLYFRRGRILWIRRCKVIVLQHGASYILVVISWHIVDASKSSVNDRPLFPVSLLALCSQQAQPREHCFQLGFQRRSSWLCELWFRMLPSWAQSTFMSNSICLQRTQNSKCLSFV